MKALLLTLVLALLLVEGSATRCHKCNDYTGECTEVNCPSGYTGCYAYKSYTGRVDAGCASPRSCMTGMNCCGTDLCNNPKEVK